MLICLVKRDITALVEGIVMSIINKMHQDFQQLQQAQPILASMPDKRNKHKPLLLIAIALLLGSSLTLASLIFSQDNAQTAMPPVKVQPPQTLPLLSSQVLTPAPVRVEQEKVKVEPIRVTKKVEPIRVTKTLLKEVITEPLATAVVVNAAPVAQVKSIAPEKIAQQKAAINHSPVTAIETTIETTTAIATASINEPKSAGKQLEISVSQLSKAELAQLHIKEGDKAQAQGDFELAIKKKLRALALLPNLNELRKSVALYYYGQGDVDSAQRLLKKGGLVSPDYPDFNLMLSRIALKEGDQHKAYLYLEKNPPQVEGNLDYYASHAILAQKFQKYEQSESLYSSLLTQLPNNGRWRMSLAIVQDRQDKIDLAVNNYKKALLQTDLSAKAKVYINQRLAYLGKN